MIRTIAFGGLFWVSRFLGKYQIEKEPCILLLLSGLSKPEKPEIWGLGCRFVWVWCLGFSESPPTVMPAFLIFRTNNQDPKGLKFPGIVNISPSYKEVCAM